MQTGHNYVEFLGHRDELDEANLKYLPILVRGISALSNCYSIFNSPGFHSKSDWKKELVKDDVQIYSTIIEHGRMFNLSYKVPIPLQEYLAFDWDGLEHMAELNDDVDFARRLVTLTKNADIVHYANKAIMMVSAREYLSIRVRRFDNDGSVYTSGYSIDDMPNMPGADGRIRGFLHVSAGRFRQDPTDPRSTILDLIICIDVGGMIPKSLINSMMPKQLHKETEKVKKMLAENRHKRK